MANWSYNAQRRAGRLTVEQGLTIAGVRDFREALLRGFETADQVVIDFAATDDVDVAGLQLLCAAHRFAVAHGKQLSLAGVCDRARELARAAGFAHGGRCSIDRDVPCLWTKMA